ncbi:transposase [Bradyrhizobium sp. USDA 3315]
MIELLMPRPSKVGRPRKTSMRSVWDAIQYIATTGCQWALLPKDFPPFTTVQYYFYGLRDSGMLDLINEAWLKSRVGLLDGSHNQRRRSSTANRSRQPRAEGHAALMRARQSKIASATSSPIHKEIC